MVLICRVCLIFVLVAGYAACQKENSLPADPADPNAATPAPPAVITGPRLSYGDSVFFPQTLSADYTILPVSKRDQPGYFRSIPRGLVLDSATGRINVSRSESGVRYKIYQVSSAGYVLDSVKLVISGVEYYDAIYEIASTPNRYDTAFPVYNARPELPLPCLDTDDDDDDGCIFDETDLDADGNDDIPGVIQEKLLVDIKKGTIDLEASFNAGIFGSSDPANGLSKDFTFYYRLQDASNLTLNKITVRVMHYRKRSDIPQALLDTLNLRRDLTIAINKRMTPLSGQRAAFQAGGLEQEYTPDEIRELGTKPKRPPIIIIVSQ